MVCEEKVETAGMLSWIDTEPAEQDAPISVWWDEPPVGEDDDGYTNLRAGLRNVTVRKPRA